MPNLNPDSYDFQIIDGTYYPIPNKEYVKIKKNHALQEFFTALFQKYGFGNEAYKWVGFIPHEIADKMVAKGDMLTESRLGNGLLHGKVSHMLQRLLLLYGIKNREITLDNNISINDIFNGLVTIKEHNKERTVWGVVRDTRVFGSVSFTDPHRLSSVIMHDGKALGISTLSDYLIDTFCNGLIHLVHAYQQNCDFSDLDLPTFIEYLQDMQSALFDIPSAVSKNSIKAEILAGNLEKESENDSYGCVKKYYKTNNFVPKSYMELEPSQFNSSSMS